MCVGRGASGSCSQDFLAECSGQPFFAPSTLGDEWERSSSVCSGRCWCPWYSGGQEAHPAPALTFWGLTPSRVLLSRFSTGSGEPSWNVALAWSWVVREGFLEEVDC